MTGFLAWLLNLLGGGVVERVLSHMEQKANSDTERQRIQATREANANKMAASVIKEGMQHRVFWIAWGLAAIPTCLWFGWGMLDSWANGKLWDVTELPPQLLAYADVVFQNIFYSGAALGGVQMIAGAIRNRK